MSDRGWIEALASATLALALAFVIWLAATAGQGPVTTREIPSLPSEAGVPIGFTGLPEGRAVYAPNLRTVRLDLRGIQGSVEEAAPEDFEATVDLSGAAADATSFVGPVTLRCRDSWRCLRRGLRIAGHEPMAVQVRLGPIVTGTLPVLVEFDGDPPVGYVVTRKASDPATVAVRGAGEAVAKVKQVVARVEGVGRQTQARRRADDVVLEPRDEFGRAVPDVVVEPPTADVVLQTERQGLPVYVTPEYVGTVADGYLIVDFAVEPQYVQVEGPPELVDSLPNLAPIVDLSGIDTDLVTRVPLELPEGVTALNAPEGVTVTVRVAPLQDARSMEVPLGATGLGPGLRARLVPESVRILLNGPRPVLDALEAEDLSAGVDLSGLGVGRHTVDATVRPPEGARVRSVQPSRVEAIIEGRGATPSPGRP